MIKSREFVQSTIKLLSSSLQKSKLVKKNSKHIWWKCKLIKISEKYKI